MGAAPLFDGGTRRACAEYAVALALCAIILIITLKLWQADLHVPFSYHGDSLLAQFWIKGIIEQGWYLHQDRVGIPGGSDMHDYPMADNLHFGLLKLLSFFSSDTAVVFNWFFLLSFPLVLISSLAVFRQLVAGRIAIVLALLYTFLPFHFLRGLEGHIFLMSYFMIPPAVLLTLWICLGPDQGGMNRFTKAQWSLAFLICAGLSSSGIYYAFFGCVLFGLGGLINLGHRNIRGAATAVTLIGLVVLGVILNVLPSILYRQNHGANPDAVVRALSAPEIYGLKITQLVLPMSVHRISWLAKEKLAYHAALPQGCADFGYLGFLGAAGFIGLLGRLLCIRAGRPSRGILDVLQVLNISVVLLGTVGGLGMVGCLFLGTWLRCFERMSIVIAFFSLLAVGVVVGEMIKRFPGLNRSGILLPGVLGCVLAGGIWEETSSHFIPKYAALKREYGQDADFLKQIEKSLPPGAALFQLPYVPFPENGFLCRMGDYDHLRAYLHSRKLRWSYGAIKGREGDAWQKQAALLPVEAMTPALLAEGFDGLYLDRYGYDGDAARIEKELTLLLGPPRLISPNARFSFFKLSDYQAPSRAERNR